MFVAQAHAQTETPAAPHAAPDGHATGEPIPTEALQAGVEHPTEGHGGIFPPFNPQYYGSQVLWLAITFGLFYYFLNKIIVPQVGGTLANRRARIAADLDAAQKMKADADAAQAAYEQGLAAARSRSHAIASQARDTTKADAEAERRRVEADLDAKLEASQVRIGEIKRQALAEVGHIAEDVTQTILSDIAKIDVSREDAAGAVARSR